MANDEQNDPMWKPGDLGFNESAVVTLESATHTATGTSQYGDWFLWVVQVEDTTVFDKKTKESIPNYTGKAIVFPSETLQKGFLAATNSTKEGVKVKVTSVPKKTVKGSAYNTYEVEVVEGGTTDENTLQGNHTNFLNDFRALVEGGAFKGEKEDFIGFSKTDAYKIPEATIDKLWNVYNESK